VFILRECSHPKPCPETKTDTVTIVKVDTVVIEKHYPKPPPDMVIDSVWSWMSVDTAEILRECKIIGNDYNAYRIYRRRIEFDTNGYLNIQDTVHLNLLQGYYTDAHFKAYTHTQIVTNTIIPKERLSFHIGAVMAYKLDNSFSIAPSFALVTKKKHVYNAYYDPFLKQIGIGFYLKLF